MNLQLSINYLSPLVTELQQIWNGITLKLPDGSKQRFRGALLTVACDMLASRKVCGFLGCPRCYYDFLEGGSTHRSL